jgi:hypothetical protein
VEQRKKRKMKSTEIEISLEEQFGETPSEIISCYGGQVKLIYNDGVHTYWVDTPEGRIVVPGVTSIVKMVDKSHKLVPWAVKLTVESVLEQLGKYKRFDNLIYSVPAERLQEILKTAKAAHRAAKDNAGGVGKIAHDWLEKYGNYRIAGRTHQQALTIPRPLNQKSNNCIDAALSWFDEHHVVFFSAERKVYSREYNYAGTMDWDGLVDGKLSIIDYKTSNGIYDDYWFQTAMYQGAREEEFPDKQYEQRVVLRLGKEDGEFEAQVREGRYEYEADLSVGRAMLVAYERLEELKARAKAEKEAKKPAKKIKTEIKLEGV